MCLVSSSTLALPIKQNQQKKISSWWQKNNISFSLNVLTSLRFPLFIFLTPPSPRLMKFLSNEHWCHACHPMSLPNSWSTKSWNDYHWVQEQQRSKNILASSHIWEMVFKYGPECQKWFSKDGLRATTIDKHFVYFLCFFSKIILYGAKNHDFETNKFPQSCACNKSDNKYRIFVFGVVANTTFCFIRSQRNMFLFCLLCFGSQSHSLSSLRCNIFAIISQYDGRDAFITWCHGFDHQHEFQLLLEYLPTF